MNVSEKIINSKNFMGWNTASHLNTFNFWNSYSNRTFNFSYGNFQENRFLIDTLRNNEVKSVVDIGCATGTSYRLLKNNFTHSEFEYAGFDISEVAIQHAYSIYKKPIFFSSNSHDFKDLDPSKRDIIFSRDTVMHQDEPLKFLRKLIKYASRFLIIRLRTRDNGKTNWNVNQSCQMHYDKHWMPYIVINTDELVDFIIKVRKPASISINKSYEILGGNNYRYLPKDLYFSSAGGAETSILIDFKRLNNKETIIKTTKRLEGQQFLQKNRIKYIVHRKIDQFLSRGKQVTI
ncbi:methyltransferase domain-containing protein [bacterium]|nr:methyltransferase domain-containing protein [bacterium]